MRIAAIVVTYNRKFLLLECLKALKEQSAHISTIFIIDNHSTDGTRDLLLKEAYIDKDSTNSYILDESGVHASFDNTSIDAIQSVTDGAGRFVQINYVRLNDNYGGAGGFYVGQHFAYKSNHEWVWMMDDDGYPSSNCLMDLLSSAEKNQLYVLNPLVINIKDHNVLSFGLPKHIETVECARSAASADGLILGEANPFNGTLVHASVIEQVGFVKKEMFIWGDEVEYFMRLKAKSIIFGTYVHALFYHPKTKTSHDKMLFGALTIPIKPAHLAMNYYRNLGYLNSISGRILSHKTLPKLLLFYLLKMDMHSMWCVFQYYLDGALNKYRLPNVRKDVI